jgi:hypothetical protein
MGAVLTAVLIGIILLIILGLGVTGTFEAIQTGWDAVPAQNIVDNFKEATEKSAKELVQEVSVKVPVKELIQGP